MMFRDAEEGIGAFIEKRAPRWKGRSAYAAATCMNHDRYDDAYIADILDTVKTIAMVGASANASRPSYFAMKYLLGKSFTVIPVNPGLGGKEILGQKVVAALADITTQVDMVDIFRNSAAALEITRECIRLKDKLGLKVVWMQLSVRNDKAAREAEAAGTAKSS